jgi:hypothetical protein
MKKIKGEVWLTEGREAHRVALFPFGQSALSYPQALRFFEVRERSYRIVRREDRMVLETFEWCGDRLAVPPKVRLGRDRTTFRKFILTYIHRTGSSTPCFGGQRMKLGVPRRLWSIGAL